MMRRGSHASRVACLAQSQYSCGLQGWRVAPSEGAERGAFRRRSVYRWTPPGGCRPHLPQATHALHREGSVSDRFLKIEPKKCREILGLSPGVGGAG